VDQEAWRRGFKGFKRFNGFKEFKGFKGFDGFGFWVRGFMVLTQV
jgi:hypothetical protein